MAVTTEDVPPEPRVKPNIDAIIDMLRHDGDIPNAEKAQQDGMSKLGTLYKRVEKDLHGNRGAVAAIRKLQKMSEDKRNDYLRTLEPLLVHFKYTLDDIDPADLVAQAEKAGADGDQGHNAPGPLDKARGQLSGAEPGAEDLAAKKNGSVQLRKFVGALRAGRTPEEAGVIAEIDGNEIQMHVTAEAAGEYKDLDAIEPPAKRGKPKLGIVHPGSDTAQ